MKVVTIEPVCPPLRAFLTKSIGLRGGGMAGEQSGGIRCPVLAFTGMVAS
jgi:hypothetical protein